MATAVPDPRFDAERTRRELDVMARRLRETLALLHVEVARIEREGKNGKGGDGGRAAPDRGSGSE